MFSMGHLFPNTNIYETPLLYKMVNFLIIAYYTTLPFALIATGDVDCQAPII